MSYKTHLLTLGLFLLFPTLLLANFHQFQQQPNPSFIVNLIGSIGAILNMLIPIMIALALVVFFWGLIRFIASAGDEEKRKSGRQVMVWGIIILAVMVSIWGIVILLQGIFGVGGTGTPPPPGLPGVPSSDQVCISVPFFGTICF